MLLSEDYGAQLVRRLPVSSIEIMAIILYYVLIFNVLKMRMNNSLNLSGILIVLFVFIG